MYGKLTMVAAILAAGAASATTIDFESGVPPEVSGTGDVVAVAGLDGYNGFTGNFLWNKGAAGDATDVSLTGLASHDTVTVSFSLALIDSWDGMSGNPAPDYFNILADGVEVFEISVANAPLGSGEMIPTEATNRSAPSNLIGKRFNESLFDVSLSFAHTGSTLALSMFADGAGWQGYNDESWGIDNLEVTTSTVGGVAPVPLPAGFPLMLAGLAGLGVASRRRKA